MSNLRDISLSDIDVGQRLRMISEDQVERLKTSVLAVGLLNPITVFPQEDGKPYGLIAGAHRYELFRRLGYDSIPAQISDLDDLERVIAECDENLCGPRLSASERAFFTSRRKDAYEARYPETKREATLRQGAETPSRQNGETEKVERFTSDTAAKTGQSERAVQRDAERGEKVAPEALASVKGTALDTGTYLDKLKKVSKQEQVETVKRDLEQPMGGISGRYTAAPARELSWDERFARFTKAMDAVEAIEVAPLMAGAGRHRAKIKHRAASLARKLDEILEASG